MFLKGRSEGNHVLRCAVAHCALAMFMLVGLTPPAALAATPQVPEDFQARYQLSINSFNIGEAEVTLSSQDDGFYRYQSHTHPTGIAKLFRSDVVKESSQFSLHKGWPRPHEYRFDHTGSKKGRHAFLKFDWKALEVANTVEGHTWEMEIPATALDKLLVQVAVMMDLSAGKEQLTYAIADGGKLKEYHFAIVGPEKIKVPAGEFDVIKLERLRKDNDRTTYFWCAESLGYLPVRIKQIEHEDGVTYLSELMTSSLIAPAAAAAPAETPENKP